MKLFLDVDGVLLGRDGRLAGHAIEFLQFVTQTFDVFWLTTHVRENNSESVVAHILQGTSARQHDAVVEVAKAIRPAPWPTWKTDALPDDGDFMWLDDSPTATEIEFLRERGWLNRWLHVDVVAEPDDLLRARRVLTSRSAT